MKSIIRSACVNSNSCLWHRQSKCHREISASSAKIDGHDSTVKIDDGVVQFSRIGSNEAADCFVRPRSWHILTGKCTKRPADTETMTKMDRDGERGGRGRIEGSKANRFSGSADWNEFQIIISNQSIGMIDSMLKNILINNSRTASSTLLSSSTTRPE